MCVGFCVYIYIYIYMYVHMYLNPFPPPFPAQNKPSQIKHCKANMVYTEETLCAYKVLNHANLPPIMACHQWTFRQAAFLWALCLQMGAEPPPPPLALVNLKPCEAVSKNGAPSIDIPSSSLSVSILQPGGLPQQPRSFFIFKDCPDFQWTFLQVTFLRAFCLQMWGGCAQPSPLFLNFKPCEFAWNGSLPSTHFFPSWSLSQKPIIRPAPSSRANLPQRMACHQWTFRQAAFLRAFCLQMGGLAPPPPPPPSFFYFKPCKPDSKNGAPSMDIPSSSWALLPCRPAFKSDVLRPPVVCYPKQRVRPIPPAVMRAR